MISEDGANLLARSTPIAFSISGKTWVNNHAHVLRFDEYATRRYVEMYLNSIDLSYYITGAAQPKLNQKNLNKIEIPLPDLEEQKRIITRANLLADKAIEIWKYPVLTEDELKPYATPQKVAAGYSIESYDLNKDTRELFDVLDTL